MRAIVGSVLLWGAGTPAHASQELFASLCAGCHNDGTHPKALVYNAAGKVSMIEALNALGMGAKGTLDDHTSIAAWLDTVKPTITLAPVPRDSPGTKIELWDIIVSGAEAHADWQQIASIATVSPPAKGTVTYKFENGFAKPSYVTYTPFPGQSGVDTWTYQGSGPGETTTIRTASVMIGDAGAANYQGLWWASGGTEKGWGINFAHQGDQLFATWYTYDTTGKAWWLSMLANRTGGNTFSGPIEASTGPPFNAYVGGFVHNPIGNGTLAFTDANNGSFTYTVNGTMQAKAIARFDLGTGPQPVCTYSAATPNFALATNYQDLWWVANGAEAGWGVNFAHQGNSVFATWYTYDADRTPLWLSALTTRVGATNVYTGTLYRSAGPRFDAYDAAQWQPTQVGTATLTFADGNNATFAYTTNGVTGLPATSQAKTVTRFPFAAAGGTLCQ